MSTIDFTLSGDFTKLANARILQGSVVTVNADRTLDLTVLGVSINSVPAKYHCRHQHTRHAPLVFLPGDVVICLYTGQGANPSAANLVVMGFPGGYLRDCEIKGFISNPRLFGVNDGYTEIAETISAVGSGSISYPLDDSTNTSQSLVVAAGRPLITVRAEQLYGNIDWIGWPTENTPAPVLTWKGPPGRSIPVKPDTYIEGLSTPDISFNESEYWTVFGPSIYSGGSIAYTVPVTGDVPPKIVGCALQGGSLVCVVNNHYATLTGFFEEVWVNRGDPELHDATLHPNGWKKLSTRDTGRATQCWFFNQSGTKATQGVAEYSIDLATETVTKDEGSPTYLSAQFKLDGAAHEVVYSGSTVLWSDYKGDARVFAAVTASGGGRFDFQSNEQSTVTPAPVYMQGAKPPTTMWVDGPEQAYAGAQYNAVGNPDACCTGGTITWSFSAGTIDSNGNITSIGSCGLGTVVATVCGVEFSKQVRLPNGVWKLIGTSHGACSGINISPLGPCYVDNCANHYAMNTTCAIRWWDENGYRTVVEENATTRISTSWGKAEIAYTTISYVADSGAGSGNTTPPSDLTPGWQAAAASSATYEWWCTTTTRGW